MGHSIIHVDDITPAGPGDAVRFVRRELGVGAFGINWYELGPNVVGREHDEADTGQEEVHVVIRGSGVSWIEDEEVPARAGTFIRSIPKPPALRSPGPKA